MTSINKHSLISAISAITTIRSYGSSLCTALILCACSTLGSCTNDSDPLSGEGSQSRQPLTIRVSASSFTSLLHEGTPSTRTTEDGYETKFTGGEEIGVFAITNLGNPTAAYADNINNLKLVCSVDPTTQKVTWTPEDPDKLLCYYDNLTYIAYYPYKQDITINISGSATSAAILQQLAANSNLQPLSNQSTEANYKASNLMTAVATPTAAPSGTDQAIVSLNFEHQYSLLILKPFTVLNNYTPPSGAGYEYSTGVPDIAAKDAIINDIEALPMSDGTFRAILKTNAASAVVPTGSYKTEGDKAVLYTGNAINAGTLVAGKYYTQQVGISYHPVAPTERGLQIGDFYCSDGTVLPHDIPFNGTPADCIGIVYYAGPGPDDVFSNYGDTGIQGDIHGYVVALKDAYPSDTDKKWGRRDVYFEIGQTTQFNGYTKKYAEQTNGLCQAAAEIRNFRISVPVPPTASNWYMPSYAQLQTIWNAYKHSADGIIYSSLQKVGGDLFANQQYWTVTEYDRQDVWCINMQTGTTASNIGKCSGKDMGWAWVAYSGIHLTRTVLTF